MPSASYALSMVNALLVRRPPNQTAYSRRAAEHQGAGIRHVKLGVADAKPWPTMTVLLWVASVLRPRRWPRTSAPSGHGW
jgi:hypothetical protein